MATGCFQTVDGTNNTYGDVIISNGSQVITRQLEVKPGTNRRAYELKLDETGGWFQGSGSTGPLASKDYIKQVFSNVTSLRIRAKYTGSADLKAGIENVTLFKWKVGLGPMISDFTPSSGKPGTPLTITGLNFSENRDENHVFFGGMKAEITNATSTQLAVKVPAGAQYSSITVINDKTGNSSTTTQRFNPLFDNDGDFGGRITPASLEKQGSITIDATYNNNIKGLNIGDVDGDGKNDVIATEGTQKKIYIYRNLGLGGDITEASFAPKITLDKGDGRTILGDFDGDGKLDIVSTHHEGNYSYLVFHHNTSTPGNISFKEPTLSLTPSYLTRDIAASDLDGDGLQEIIATHPNGGLGMYLWVHHNVSYRGKIEFAYGKSFSSGLTGISKVVVEDLNNDGKAEIVVVSGNICILQNISSIGNVRFEPLIKFAVSPGVYDVIVNDFDKDNKPDFLVRSGNPKDVIIRKNTHSGDGLLKISDFETEFVFASELLNYGNVTMTDMNSDDKPDVIINDQSNLAVFENTSDGNTLDATSFDEGTVFEGVNNGNSVRPAIGDLNGDNKPDVVMSFSSNGGARLLFFKNTSFPSPVINAVTNASSQPIRTMSIDGTVKLKGSNFKTANEEPFIALAGAPVSIVSVSNAEAAIKVDATQVNKRISVINHGLTAFAPTTVSTIYATEGPLNEMTFSNHVDIPLTSVSTGLDVADLNNDGTLDILVEENQATAVFLNSSHTPGATIASGMFTKYAANITRGNAVRTSDFDGDGKLDVIANGSLYRNSSAGGTLSFEAPVSGNISGNTRYLVNYDFNKDGKPDLVSVYREGNLVTIHRNQTRKGSFSTLPIISSFVHSGNAIKYNTGGAVQEITAADFDGDGYDDIAYGVSSATDNVTVIRNKGRNRRLTSESFEEAKTFPAGDVPLSIGSGDFDGDGQPDLAVGNNASEFLSIYKNTSTTGNISFTRTDIPSISKANSVEVADIDGDGKPDVLVTYNTTNTTGSFAIFKNTSTSSAISFTRIDYLLPNVPYNLEVADLNHDNKLDILIARSSGSEKFLSIFENKLVIDESVIPDPDPDPVTSVEENYLEKTIVIYPNPAKEYFNVKYSAESSRKEVSIKLYNAQGRIIQETKSSSSLDSEFNFDTSSYQSGVYHLVVSDGVKTVSRKVLLVR